MPAADRNQADGPEGKSPSVLIFDVNETLLDLESLDPIFEQAFGDKRVLREWFGQLVMYSMTVTLSGLYEDFFALGVGVFEMLGAIHMKSIRPSDVEALENGMMTMPAHPDVRDGLKRLKGAGFRLVTLTNSPPSADGKSPLSRAGLADYFERQFSIQTVRSYKPAQVVYRTVARELGVPPEACCMVASHVWDTIGAQSAGMAGALITRPGNAPLPVPGLPQPNVIASDMLGLAAQMIARWRAGRSDSTSFLMSSPNSS